MTHTTIEILSIGTSLAALFGAVIVVDWPHICEWWADRKFRRALKAWQNSPRKQALDHAEYVAAASQMQGTISLGEFLCRVQPIAPEAKHPMDGVPYNR